MKITRHVVRDQLLAYLNRSITLAQLVDWAENVLCEGEMEAQDAELLTRIVARLGLADVRAFGLSWDDCYDFLAQLGYAVQIEAIPLAA
jgi:hypothetical protein